MSRLVLSLFPGIGLLDMAFEQEGFCVVRGPDVLWGGDIRRLHPPSGRFDGVLGGPPCQPFSSLRYLLKRRGYAPRHPNLIPEFERCVREAMPDWFLMEEVPAAPVPAVVGYAAHAFILNNTWLGETQRRKRRFTFGLRGEPAPDLRRWIPFAALELPEVKGTAYQGTVNNGNDAKGRVKQPAALATGKISPGTAMRMRFKQNAIMAGHGPLPDNRGITKRGAVTSSDGGPTVRMSRYTLAEMLDLQGLPPDFLRESPFTVEAKRQAIGNGVPLAMGRALARAIKQALEERA